MLRLLVLALTVCVSTSVNASNDKYALGVSTWAMSQVLEYRQYEDGDYRGTLVEHENYRGLQVFGTVNLHNNAQFFLGAYRSQNEDESELELNGYNLQFHLGTGFQEKGFKVYCTLGHFRETFISTHTSKREAVTGAILGAAIGYNFDPVSIDWGISRRTSSDYEKDDVYGDGTNVESATGFLALSVNF